MNVSEIANLTYASKSSCSKIFKCLNVQFISSVSSTTNKYIEMYDIVLHILYLVSIRYHVYVMVIMLKNLSTDFSFVFRILLDIIIIRLQNYYMTLSTISEKMEELFFWHVNICGWFASFGSHKVKKKRNHIFMKYETCNLYTYVLYNITICKI